MSTDNLETIPPQEETPKAPAEKTELTPQEATAKMLSVVFLDQAMRFMGMHYQEEGKLIYAQVRKRAVENNPRLLKRFENDENFMSATPFMKEVENLRKKADNYLRRKHDEIVGNNDEQTAMKILQNMYAMADQIGYIAQVVSASEKPHEIGMLIQLYQQGQFKTMFEEVERKAAEKKNGETPAEQQQSAESETPQTETPQVEGEEKIITN